MVFSRSVRVLGLQPWALPSPRQRLTARPISTPGRGAAMEREGSRREDGFSERGAGGSRRRSDFELGEAVFGIVRPRSPASAPLRPAGARASFIEGTRVPEQHASVRQPEWAGASPKGCLRCQEVCHT